MAVTVQYMPDCPNWQQALDHVQQALRRVGQDEPVELVAVTTAEEAASVGFRGSPTVLIEGWDPFNDESLQVGLSCRLFSTPDGPAVAPTVDQLVKSLRP